MAADHQTDVPIVLDGRQFVMRPTFRALSNIELALGQDLVPIVRDVGRGDLGIRKTAVIVCEGLKAFRDEGQAIDQVGELIAKTGLSDPALLAALMRFFEIALSGGAAKPEKPETAAESPPPASLTAV